MPSTRAPLFSVSIAFAIGCVLGLDNFLGLRPALLLVAIATALWLIARKHEPASLAAFYALVICAGLAHTVLLAQTISPDDLRRLPDGKLLETTQWRGVIAEEPASQLTPHASRRALDRTTFVFHIDAWRLAQGRLFAADIGTPWNSATGDIQCILLGPSGELRCGDQLEFSAALEPIPPALCPGEFNSRDMAARHGIYYQATVTPTNWRRIQAGGGDWLQRLSYAARDWAYGRLQLGLEDDPRTADFLAGMLIGYRQQIPQDIEQDFRRTGTMHVFAVSGQNIAEMFVVALILLQLCGLVRWRWAWLTAPLVLLYCFLTGSPASAIRATVMALAILLAWRLGRPLNALACWSLAFLAMLVWNPSVLLDFGAQLSFGIVLGLILFALPLMRWLARPFAIDPFLPRELLTTPQKIEERSWRALALLLASGLAAGVITEPITAIDFHQVTPIAILLNLIVIPTAGLITIVGTLSVTVSLVSASLAASLNNANWLFARLLILFVGFFSHTPGAAINVPDIAALESPTPSLVVAPMRDSACLLIRTGQGTWLVNTGRESPGPSPLWHFLQFYGINRLDGLVLAQISAADNSGAEAIARDFRPRQLIVPVLHTKSPLEKELAEMDAASGDPPETWQAGQTIPLGAHITAEVLHPAADSPETRADDRGLVILFHVGARSLLWAGRIGPAAQSEILASRSNLHADVLVMGTEPPPDPSWLTALQVRDWLQIPPHDSRLNVIDSAAVPDTCQVWPLNKTGAIDLHFQDDPAPGQILLRPWLAPPDQ